MAEQVSVVIGAGALGSEVAERLSHESTVVIADFRKQPMLEVAGRTILAGGTIVTKDVDVRNRASVRALAAFAASQGTITRLVHAAGVSPTHALVEAIFSVDMVGAALVIEEFEGLIAVGGAAVVVAGAAGHLLDPAVFDTKLEEEILAGRPEDLLLLADVKAALSHADMDEARAFAHAFAKRVNRLHVRAAAARWGLRGARINSLSPGDLGAPSAPADAVEFLLGPGSAAITGTDLLVDGGGLAAATYPAWRDHPA